MEFGREQEELLRGLQRGGRAAVAVLLHVLGVNDPAAVAVEPAGREQQPDLVKRIGMANGKKYLQPEAIEPEPEPVEGAEAEPEEVGDRDDAYPVEAEQPATGA